MRIYDIIEPLKSRTKESQGPQQKCRAQKIHCQAVLQRGPHLHNIIRPFTQTNMMPLKDVSLTSLKGETLLSFWPAKWPKWLACRWIPFFWNKPTSILPTSSWVILDYHWKKLFLSWEFKHLEIYLVIGPSWADYHTFLINLVAPLTFPGHHPSPSEPLLLGPWTIQWTHLRVHLDSQWRSQGSGAAFSHQKRCQHVWKNEVYNFSISLPSQPIQSNSFQTSM